MSPNEKRLIATGCNEPFNLLVGRQDLNWSSLRCTTHVNPHFWPPVNFKPESLTQSRKGAENFYNSFLHALFAPSRLCVKFFFSKWLTKFVAIFFRM